MSWPPPFFDKRKAELAEELQTHLQMEIADRVSRGETLEQASRAAEQAFGNVAAIQDVTHSFWHLTRVERLTGDLRFALRMLRRAPGFTLTVVLTLAIGVGATCAMFTVVDHTLLRPVRFRDASRLVTITQIGVRGSEQEGSAAFPDISQWQQRSRSFQVIAFYDKNDSRSWFLDAGNATIHVSTASVAANLFPTLGLKPELGRGFLANDSSGLVKPEDEHAILLSDTVWREAFAADPAVVGKLTHINGDAFTIIGVMPPGIVFPYGAGLWNGLPVVWHPIGVDDADMTRSSSEQRYHVIARLNQHISLATAQQELRAIQADLAKAYTDPYDRDHVTSVNLEGYAHSLVDRDTRKATLALLGASAMLWLIACVNAAGLMFARSTARQREFAVRGALGASRMQIIQQLMVESALLAMSSSALGVILAVAMLKAFEHGLVTQFHLHETLRPDVRMLAALLLMTACSTVAVALWPALGVVRTRFETRLRQGSPAAGVSRKQQRVRAALVVTEISLALTLLVGCGLLLRTLYALEHVPLGFRTEHVLVANMTVPSYLFTDRNMTTQLYQPLIERVKQLPGVESAALMTEVPLGHTFKMIFTLGDSGQRPLDLARRQIKAQFRAVGPEMQHVFGFRMLRGRFFNNADTATSQAVVVVNRAFVRAYFGDDRDPSAMLGETLVSYSKDRRSVVVGVLDDERQVSVAEPSQPEIEVCIPQITPDSMFYKPAEGMAMAVAVRTAGDPGQVMPALRRVLGEASPDLGEALFSTMDEIVADSFGSQRLAAQLLGIFAASALLLTLAGIYGVLVYNVAQRRQELGVRIALGAQKWDILALILKQACWMLGLGLALGTGLSLLSSRWLTVFLYDVKPNDPILGLIVAAVLFAGGLCAALIPARRAASVDPVEMLRAE